MKKKIAFVFLLAICYAAVFQISCSKEKVTERKEDKTLQKRELKNKILLILGKDYQTRPCITECFTKEYTEQSVKENIYMLEYSEFFISTKRARLKTIIDRIDEVLPDVIISIGIPEGAGKYLSQAAEKYPLLTIISLLPMEEILPLEAASDIVVDFELPDTLLNQESDFKISDEDVSLLILTSVFYGEDLNLRQKQIDIFPIEEFRLSFSKAEKILRRTDKIYSLKPYSDPETNISSYKYLVIYELENKNSETAEFELFKKKNENYEEDESELLFSGD